MTPAAFPFSSLQIKLLSLWFPSKSGTRTLTTRAPLCIRRCSAVGRKGGWRGGVRPWGCRLRISQVLPEEKNRETSQISSWTQLWCLEGQSHFGK
jgi:hypothetical protein